MADLKRNTGGFVDIFNHYYKRYDAWYERNRFAYLSELEVIKKVLPKKGKGLEIGVGTGRFAQALGITAGVDPAKNMVKIARQRGVEAYVASGEDLPFEEGSFDYVAIIITISFTKDPRKVLKEAARVLKREGKVIVGIVDKNSFLGKFYQKKKGVFYKQASFFSVSEITNLLEEAGFSKFSYYQTVFDFPDKINSIEKPQKGFGKAGFVVISAKRN